MDDDGFIFWTFDLNFEHLKTSLNKVLSFIKSTFEKVKRIYKNGKPIHVLKLLDIKIILQEDNSIKTDIYYKPTNNDYLPYDSAYPNHAKTISPLTWKKELLFLFQIQRK